MILNELDYKELLVIIYFNTHKSSYKYNEICNQLGINIESLDKIVSDLILKGFLGYNRDNIVSLSEIGRSYLESINLSEFSLTEKIVEEADHSDLIKYNPEIVNEIYIPKKFNRKFKGNKKIRVL